MAEVGQYLTMVRMIGMKNNHGCEIAGAIRGCSMSLFVPVIAICIGIVAGQRMGVCVGILTGIGGLFGGVWGLRRLIQMSKSGLSLVDCFIPLIFSIVFGVIFMSIQLFAGSFFSAATCIFSGALMTVGLICYRCGRIGNPWYLLPIALTYFYELLPIELPTDLDNILSLGGSTVAYIYGLKSGHLVKSIADYFNGGSVIFNEDTEKKEVEI